MSAEAAAEPLRAANASAAGGTSAVFGRQVWELAIGLTAVASAISTYLVISGSSPIAVTPRAIAILLGTNVVLAIILAGLVAWRLWRLWAERRRGEAGAVLHVRLVSIFSAIAIVPTVMIAVFAAVMLNLGINAWFSERVRTAIENAASLAEAYVQEHRQAIKADVLALARDIGAAPPFAERDPDFQAFFQRKTLERSLSAAVIYDSEANAIVGVRFTYMVDVSAPPREALRQADGGEVVYLSDGSADVGSPRVQALVRLPGGRYLLAVRYIDEEVLANQQRALAAASEYQRLERDLSSVQLTFAAVYAVVGLLMLLAAVSLGLRAADRIVAPIGRLIGASERVSAGDLTVRVEVGEKADELSTLSTAFNRMTGELRSQQQELVDANRTAEERRRFTQAVLDGVSAGVLGVDPAGRIGVANGSAARLLGETPESLRGRAVETVAPEFEVIFAEARARPDGEAAGQIDLVRDGRTRNLTVRIAAERSAGEGASYVVTFDDMTPLVAAQRTAAWADVARRIAHEIKNPLTPIQLSAERLRRKYGREIASDPEVFEQCTSTIIRQVGDIGRMVDEFSSFARMPAPVMALADIREPVRQAVFLQKVGNPLIEYALSEPAEPVELLCDERLVVQAVTNVLKNAAEAVSARTTAPGEGRIAVALSREPDFVAIDFVDNGVGLPREGRERLFEPYVTTRAKGTGLGLAIVRKILEDHGAEMELLDAPADPARPEGTGAWVRLRFPVAAASAAAVKSGSEHEQIERLA